VEGSGRGLIRGTVLEFAYRHSGMYVPQSRDSNRISPEHRSEVPPLESDIASDVTCYKPLHLHERTARGTRFCIDITTSGSIDPYTLHG
jgi:hypothetical protein